LRGLEEDGDKNDNKPILCQHYLHVDISDKMISKIVTDIHLFNLTILNKNT